MVAKNGKAKLVAVIGDPIHHSLSPAIHEYWLIKAGINGAYVPLNIKPGMLDALLPQLLDIGFVGFNVTLPHKQAAYRLADSHDEISVKCKSSNTLIRKGDGKIHAMNTDMFGFVSLVEKQGRISAIKGQETMIIGAGGASRSVILGLYKLGATQVYLVNRTAENAQAIADDMPDLPIPLTPVNVEDGAQYASRCGIVVHTLPKSVGVPEELKSTLKATHDDCFILDISYDHNRTEMAKMAKKLGRDHSDGLEMLLWQAVPGFEQWFGITPQVSEELQTYVRDMAKS